MEDTQYSREIVHTSEDAFDTDNSKCLSNILKEGTSLFKAVDTYRDSLVDGLSENEFRSLYKHGNQADKYGVMRRLRHQFWNLFNEVQDANASLAVITENRIYRGIVHKHVYEKLLKNKLNCMFILTQPQDIRRIQEDLLYEGYAMMEEVMNLPLRNKSGTVDKSLIGTKLNIIKMIEDRHSGSVVQRAQVHSTTDKKAELPASQNDIDAMKAEIASLNKDLGKNEIVEAEVVK